MKLRTRLTIAFTILMTGMVAVSGTVAIVSAENHLVGQIDEFLDKRMDSLHEVVKIRVWQDRASKLFKFEDFLAEPDAVTQLLSADGEVIFAYPFGLPVSDSDLSLSTSLSPRTKDNSRAKTIRIQGLDYRVVSKPLPGGGLVQVGRDLSEVKSVVSEMIRSFILLGIAGIALAFLLATLVASRMTRRLSHLTRAASHVAETQDLEAYIEPIGRRVDLEINQLADSFNIMLEALSTSREQQRRLVADASHELRTPLTSLRTNIEVLARTQSIDEAERDSIIADLRNEISELGVLVEEIVQLATTSVRSKEQFIERDLVEVAHDVVQKFQRRSGRDIKLSTYGESIRNIQVSSIDRAISNLIDNAIKFSPPETEIHVEVRDGEIAVRDFGTGVKKSDQPRLFDRFFRSVETMDLPGSGLGLSIVKEIALSHGGQIFVQEPPDGRGLIVGFVI